MNDAKQATLGPAADAKKLGLPTDLTRFEMFEFFLEGTRMKFLFVSILLFAANAFAQPTAQPSRDENEIVFVGTTDPDMINAIREARSSLDEFFKLASKPPAGATEFKLKVMVRDANGVEHFWVTPFKALPESFEGRLGNEPRLVKSVKLGQNIRFSRDDISDWGYVRNGRQVGSYTICELFKKMPREQAEYYRKNHGFDC